MFLGHSNYSRSRFYHYRRFYHFHCRSIPAYPYYILSCCRSNPHSHQGCNMYHRSIADSRRCSLYKRRCHCRLGSLLSRSGKCSHGCSNRIAHSSYNCISFHRRIRSIVPYRDHIFSCYRSSEYVRQEHNNSHCSIARPQDTSNDNHLTICILRSMKHRKISARSENSGGLKCHSTGKCSRRSNVRRSIVRYSGTNRTNVAGCRSSDEH